MASFPELPSGYNPSIGAAAEAASAAGSAYNSLQNRLQAAANQQAQLYQQQQTAQQLAIQRQSQALQNGWVPVPAPPRVGAQPATAAVPAGAGPYGAPAQPGLPASPGLIDRTGNATAPQQAPTQQPSTPGAANGGPFDTSGAQTSPQAQTSPYSFDPARTVQFEGQAPLYKPTEQESGKTYIPGGQVAQIAKLAGWDGKTPVTADFSHALMLAYNEAQPKDEPSHIDTSGKFLDKDGNPVPVMIGDKTGRVRLLDLSGVKNASAQPSAQPSTPGAANGGPFDTSGAAPPSAGQPPAAQGGGASPLKFAPKEPADKSLHFEKDTDDEGNVTTRAFDAATAELVSRRTEKIGPKRKDPDAPAAPKPMSAALKVQIAKTKATALAKAETEYKKALSTAITPQDREDAAAERQASWRAAQDEYEQSISTATGQDVPHNPWADGGPVQTPPPAAAKTAAPAAGKPKTAKLSDVRAYAKKNGISEADALKKAKSEGFAITGQ